MRTPGTGTGGGGVGLEGGVAVGRGDEQLETEPEILPMPPQSVGVAAAVGDGVADGVTVGVGEGMIVGVGVTVFWTEIQLLVPVRN